MISTKLLNPTPETGFHYDTLSQVTRSQSRESIIKTGGATRSQSLTIKAKTVGVKRSQSRESKIKT